MAVDVLKSRGVPEDRILFLNLIASPEGVTSFAKRFPRLRVVTAFVDQGLDAKKYEMVPRPPMFTNGNLAISSRDLATSVTASTHSECKGTIHRPALSEILMYSGGNSVKLEWEVGYSSVPTARSSRIMIC